MSRGFHYLCAGIVAALLLLHFYFFCYAAFAAWHWTHPIADRFAISITRMHALRHKAPSKLSILFFLVLTVIGPASSNAVRTRRQLVRQLLIGLALYFGSDVFLLLDAKPTTRGTMYGVATLLGLYLIYSVLRILAALIYTRFSADIFNTYNESFPQMEHAVRNDYSIQFPARYRCRGQTRNSIVSLADIFRGTIIAGIPGSGKTRHLFRPIIQQSVEGGMALFVYDLKYDDLTRLTYNNMGNYVRNCYNLRGAFRTPPI